MNQHLINLALALAAGELVHNIIEAQQVRKKVDWLRLTMEGKPFKDSLPFAVDTRAKSYGLSFVGLIATTAVFYFIFTWLDLKGSAVLWTIVVLLLLAYVAIAYLLDKYHVEIWRLTKPLLKNVK